MAYSKAKLKSNGDRASPCFKPFLIGRTAVLKEYEVTTSAVHNLPKNPRAPPNSTRQTRWQQATPHVDPPVPHRYLTLAHNFSCTLISILYVFRATMCPSSGEITVPVRHLVFVTLCGWLVCRVGYFSWWWVH